LKNGEKNLKWMLYWSTYHGIIKLMRSNLERVQRNGWLRTAAGVTHTAAWSLTQQAFKDEALNDKAEADRLGQLDAQIEQTGTVPEMTVAGHTYQQGDLSQAGAHDLLETVIGIETTDARINAAIHAGAYAIMLASGALTFYGAMNRVIEHFARRRSR
jgi:hypothetical protein